MKQKQIDFLRSLCESITPSGWETPGQRIVADYVGKYADSVSMDCHGNLHAVVNPDAPVRIMLDAHCDETSSSSKVSASFSKAPTGNPSAASSAARLSTL